MSIFERDALPEFPGFPGTQAGTAGDLLADCLRIAPRWVSLPASATAPVQPSSIHGTTVSAASALVVAGMSEYGS